MKQQIIQRFDETPARYKPHARIDTVLYQQVGQLAEQEDVTKTEMLEELVQLGMIIKLYQLAIAANGEAA
jgi:hypothetical protein